MSKIRANFISSKNDNKAVEFTSGIVVGGAVTATNFDFNAEVYNVGTGASISNPANNVLALGTNNTEKVRITSAGNVGINETNPGGLLQVGSSSASHVIITANTGIDINDGAINLYQATSNVNATPFIISTDVGGIETEKLRVTAGGNVQIADGNLVVASGHGIDFSATADGSGTSTSELLDDYEEGSWVPTVTGLTNGNVMTLNSATETVRYIKVGRKVTLFGRFRITSKNSATGPIQLGAFPFTSDNTGTDQSNFNALQLVLHGFSLPTNANGVVFAEFQGNQTSANVYCVRDNNSWTNLDSSNVNTSVGAYVYITGSYYANS